MYSALTGTDPVIFFESQRVYDQPELFHGTDGVPVGPYEIPFGEPDIKREGKDLTILTIGATLYRALEAAKTLEADYGLSCEVIDARSIVPFNYDLVVKSVAKDRQNPAGLRRLRTRLYPANDGRQNHPVRLQ